MKKLILFAIAVVALSGCSMSIPTHKGSGVSPAARCADKFAQALTSPDAVVAGSFDCVSPKTATAEKWTTDADLQTYAQSPPVLAIDKACGLQEVQVVVNLGGSLAKFRAVEAFVYIVHVVDNSDAGPGWMTLIPGVDNKVARFQTVGASFAGCP